jgi:carboxymethylenebutenolidase
MTTRSIIVSLLLLLGPGCLLLAAEDNAAATSQLRTDAPPTLHGDMIRLSDYGTDDIAYLTLPPTAPIGGVVMIHEWWGLNAYMKSTADRLAQEGFVVLAVDLYNGQVATNATEAADLMNNLNHESAIKNITAATNFLQLSPRFHCDRVGTIGWCMGGGVSLEAALQVKGLSAAVVYYGPFEVDEKKFSKLKIPILGIFGQQDTVVKPEDVHSLDDLLTKLQKPHEFHWYDAVHAFANPSNPHYREDYANQAWALSIDFLKRELTPPPPKENMIQKIFN